ncbi:GDP-L-fucose synthase domain protein [Escherichia coli P0304777.8]|nr:GDP-L-fucose synthase domain protein [Escherichia coli P0304777.8]
MAAAAFSMELAQKSGWRTPSRCCRTLTSVRVDCTIRELAQTIAKVVVTKVGWFLMPATGWYAAQTADVTRLHQLGWYHEISLEAGLASTYQWFLENQDRFRG